MTVKYPYSLKIDPDLLRNERPLDDMKTEEQKYEELNTLRTKLDEAVRVIRGFEKMLKDPDVKLLCNGIAAQLLAGDVIEKARRFLADLEVKGETSQA